MWVLKIHDPGTKRWNYTLKPGKNSIGRDVTNDIQLNKHSVSRHHARLDYSRADDTVLLRDLDSTNGTFVNDKKIISPQYLQHDDLIQVGSATLRAHNPTTKENRTTQLAEGAHPITRELLLVSLDTHAVLLSEVAERLNTIINLEEALNEASNLMQKHLKADRCKIILEQEFDRLPELGFPTTLAQTTINQKSAMIRYRDNRLSTDSAMLLQVQSALCVPVLTNGNVIALIYMYKTNPQAKPFTKTDLEIITAISHQVALTIQRVSLINQFHEEQKLRQVFQRFISPHEVGYFMDEYKKEGKPPGLTQNYVSVLFVDIADSTGLAEKLGPEEFGKLLNRYYLTATEIIFQSKGIVRYIGDGVLAVFGMIGDSTNHEKRAVKAALRILEDITPLQAESQYPIHLGTGVNTGYAMVGYVGPEQRLEFTVLGDVVNIAHGLQHLARPNRLLVGENTYQALKEGFQVHKLSPIEIKGRTEPVKVYEIRG